MVAGFKIKEIELRSEEGTRFSPKALTIIVGPNNAGKSRFLKEVRSALLGRLSDEDGGLILGRKIISTIELLLPELTIAALLLHRSTLHCYSAPWQTATP